MTEQELIGQLEADLSRAERTGEMLVHVSRKAAKETLALLEERKELRKAKEETEARLKEREETIIRKTKAMDTLGYVLQKTKDVYALRVRYAVKKGQKYLDTYRNRRATWSYTPEGLTLFSNQDMAENFAGLTKGKVVEIVFVERNLKGKPEKGGLMR